MLAAGAASPCTAAAHTCVAKSPRGLRGADALAALSCPGVTRLHALPATDTDSQYGVGSGSYRHDYEGWDTYLYGEAAGAGGAASLDAAAGPAEAAAQWEAWHAWQAQHPGGRYPQPGGAGEDSYARYMRPDDVYWEQQAQQQAQQGVASGGGAAAAAGDGHGQHEEAAGNADEGAQEALGLIGGYGSGSESESESAGDKERADSGRGLDDDGTKSNGNAKGG